jgi:hypothetical protein
MEELALGSRGMGGLYKTLSRDRMKKDGKRAVLRSPLPNSQVRELHKGP